MLILVGPFVVEGTIGASQEKDRLSDDDKWTSRHGYYSMGVVRETLKAANGVPTTETQFIGTFEQKTAQKEGLIAGRCGVLASITT